MFVDKSKSTYVCKISFLKVDPKNPKTLLSGDHQFLVMALNIDKARNKIRLLIHNVTKQEPGVYRDFDVISIDREEQVVYF